MAEKQRLSESDTIILSLHDRWWKKVLAGEKPLEIRKTRPAGKGPYRVLVYVTGTGEIKGEFACKDFLKIPTIPETKDREVQKGNRLTRQQLKEMQDREVQKGSCLTRQQLKEYAGESGKPLWGWSVSQVKEYYTPHPLSLYGLKRPPQSWQYYRGEDVPDIMTINQLANICGHFFNAELDPDSEFSPNNGYNCRNSKNETKENGIGCCYQWSCPLENVIPADEEDCKKYGLDYEDSEFVLVYRGKQ